MDQDMQQGGGRAPMSGNGMGDQTVNPRKLFVGNLSWNLTSADLQQLFAEYGTVEDAIVLTHKFTGRSKGFGFVTMSSEEEAQAAVAALHQREVDGRSLVVNVAQPPRPREERGQGDYRPRRPGGGMGGNRRSGGGNYRSGGYQGRRRDDMNSGMGSMGGNDE